MRFCLRLRHPPKRCESLRVSRLRSITAVLKCPRVPSHFSGTTKKRSTYMVMRPCLRPRNSSKIYQPLVGNTPLSIVTVLKLPVFRLMIQRQLKNEIVVDCVECSSLKEANSQLMSSARALASNTKAFKLFFMSLLLDIACIKKPRDLCSVSTTTETSK
jgi:hypothetical protein